MTKIIGRTLFNHPNYPVAVNIGKKFARINRYGDWTNVRGIRLTKPKTTVLKVEKEIRCSIG